MAKPAKPELASIVPQLIIWFREHGYEVIVDPEAAPYASGVETVSRDDMAARPLDLVVVLGGDGNITLRSPCRGQGWNSSARREPWIAGGLTEVPLEEMYLTLEVVPDNCCSIEQRAMVSCDVVRRPRRGQL